MDDWAQCLDDLLNVDGGMSDWEVEFIDDIDHRYRDDPSWEPSERQKEKIYELYDRYC